MIACDACRKVPDDQHAYPWIVVNMPTSAPQLQVIMGRPHMYKELIFCSRMCLFTAAASPEEVQSANEG